ncbi:MAG: 4Fe-4S binding protein [Burkholderiaceae bacterium]|nr:4Fe-4S binding protein [Burkholderiaceae bacterium]
MKTLLCDCNRTMPLTRPTLERIAQALGPDAADGLQTGHTLLCRREAGAFQRAAKSGDELLVACTQESRLFLELADETEGAPGLQERPIRFVNIRETGGWSKAAREAPATVVPKIAALLAAAQLPEPDPVATVSYKSAGRVLVIGAANRALRAADMLADKLDVSLLLTDPRGRVPQTRATAVHAGRVTSLHGWLGAFDVRWQSSNPIDLDLCTRCNACIDVCPEGAISFAYQIDLDKCKSHRDCVRACDAAGAIDFERAPLETDEHFDLVLDLGDAPLIALHQPPQGYLHAGDDESLVRAVLQLRELVGEFEKPKFFQYKAKLCAHSRNERVGCDACIEVCSAQAIVSDANGSGGIIVNPNLCVGCGACTTVCPTGAMAYATPSAPHQGRHIRTLLSTYRRAGGVAAAGAPALLVHSQGEGTRLIGELGRLARTSSAIRGVPPRVLPLAVWHTASVGIDLWLAAIAQGAAQVWVLMTHEEAPEYRLAVAAQMRVAQAVLTGLGFSGEHLRLIEADDAPALDKALDASPAQAVKTPATFDVQADKRGTLDLALEHLIAQAAALPETIGLDKISSPWGSVEIDKQRCTMCLSCVGACPSAALGDNPDRPQLRFIETNCVQCGLCASTCPEQAIALVPRLLLADGGRARRQMRVINEAEPFACVRCGKPFGTLRAIEAIAGRLAGHSMFQGAAAERLKMCSDCRVIDIHTSADEVRIDRL